MALVSAVSGAGDWVHPCLRCGACCAHFRVSFYWSEGDDVTPDGVPVAMTRQLSPHLRVMRGTEGAQTRCVALSGEVGQRTHCGIYPLRSSTCRQFGASYEQGEPNTQCDAARARWGLAALGPQDWREPDCEPPQPIAA